MPGRSTGRSDRPGRACADHQVWGIDRNRRERYGARFRPAARGAELAASDRRSEPRAGLISESAGHFCPAVLYSIPKRLRLYKTNSGSVLEDSGHWFALQLSWDDLVRRDDLESSLKSCKRSSTPQPNSELFLAPIGSQEVWAAGVT